VKRGQGALKALAASHVSRANRSRRDVGPRHGLGYDDLKAEKRMQERPQVKLYFFVSLGRQFFCRVGF
jgi:hypothetical protein